MTHPFFDSFAESSTNFLDRSHAIHASVSIHVLPHKYWLDRNPLTTRVAIIGPQNAKDVLVITCGVHGSEHGSGSAIQMELLNSIKKGDVPKNVRIVLVHGVNSYGAEHMLREFPVILANGQTVYVDLNRHFLCDFKRLPETPEFIMRTLDLWSDLPPDTRKNFKNITELLVQKFQNEDDLAQVYEAIKALSKTEEDTNALLKNVMHGQYEFGQSLHFGGTAPSYIYEIITKIMGEVLSHEPDNIVHLDFHTGLRERGKRTMFALTHKHSPLDTEANIMFPNMAIGCLYGEKGGASSVKVIGALADHWQNVSLQTTGKRPPKIILPVGVEFGTTPMVPPQNMSAQFMFTHPTNLFMASARLALKSHHNDKHRLREQIVNGMREVFDPNDAEWRKAVLRGGRQLVQCALMRLAM